jgi:hypothetical protein
MPPSNAASAASPPAQHSKIRRAARLSLAACSVLAIVGLIIVSAWGDDTAPYDDPVFADIGWFAFMLFGPATLLLGVPYWIMLVREDTRRRAD